MAWKILPSAWNTNREQKLMDHLLLARQSQNLIRDSRALLKYDADSVQQTLLHMERSLRALETSERALALVEQHKSAGGEPF